MGSRQCTAPSDKYDYEHDKHLHKILFTPEGQPSIDSIGDRESEWLDDHGEEGGYRGSHAGPVHVARLAHHHGTNEDQDRGSGHGRQGLLMEEGGVQVSFDSGRLYRKGMEFRMALIRAWHSAIGWGALNVEVSLTPE